MNTANRISAAALFVSVISIIITGTYFVTYRLIDVQVLLDRVGDPEKTSGIYGKIANLEQGHKELLLSSVPVGTILPWVPTGSQQNIPDGWVVCDGVDNRAPNLSQKFLLGVTSRDQSANSGGRVDIPEATNHAHGSVTRTVHSN